MYGLASGTPPTTQNFMYWADYIKTSKTPSGRIGNRRLSRGTPGGTLPGTLRGGVDSGWNM